MDLLRSQIKKNCSLSLPEGLKDLMSDISREVLRAQPDNIPQFIADYLEVLLGVREKLSIACHLCNDTCKIICEPEFYNDLKAIGLSDEDIDIVIKIVEENWDQRNVKEQSLLIKLMKKISIEELQLPSIRDAIQRAIKLHHLKDGVLSGSENKDNQVTGGLHHTLDTYKQNKTTTEEVFMAKNFDPCTSTVSSIDPASNLKLPKCMSENEKEYAFLDYTLNSTSTGKVKFVDKNIILKSGNSDKETKSTDGDRVYDGDSNNDYNIDDGTNNDYEDHIDDNAADDSNLINDETELTDNDIEENIENDSHDDSSSSVDEDLITI